MFKRTPCYLCTKPERLPNGLCENGCKDKADYLAEKAEYQKNKRVQLGLNQYTYSVASKIRSRTRK